MHKSTKELLGKHIGRWTFESIVGTDSKGSPIFHCRCDCGTERDMLPFNILNGSSLSCGCLSSELKTKRFKTHGLTKHPLYSLWANIKYRCLNPKSSLWMLYGGRGITICDRWRDNFVAFLNDMGERPKGTSIDRIDPNGSYCPENCRWADDFTQHQNTRTNVFIEFNNKKQTVSAWAKELGFSSTILYARLKRGWSPEKALTTPSDKRCDWRSKC